MENKKQFLKELKELLEYYEVSISFKVGEGSDTYGLYGERMVIEDKNEKEIFSYNGWGIDQHIMKLKE